MNMKKISALMIIATLCLTSCNTANSPEKLALEKLTYQILKESGGYITIKGLQKTDGVEGEINGVKTYSMNFTLTIVYTKDCFKDDHDFMGNWMYSNFVVYPGNHPPTVYYMKQGLTVEIYGKANYEKHESGWVLEGLNLNNSHITYMPQ
jgi:hypothetical protein